MGLTSTCDLGYYVFSSSSVSGPWTLEWSSLVTTTSTGTTYYPSGPVGLAVTTGTFYALGVGWDCSATYYGLSTSGLGGTDVGVGDFRSNAYNNSYPLFSASFRPDGTGSSGLAYNQIVTVVP